MIIIVILTIFKSLLSLFLYDRLMALYRYDEGVAGHMTFRDPEYPDLFW